MSVRIILNSINKVNRRCFSKKCVSKSVNKSFANTEKDYFDNMSTGLVYYSCEDPAIAEKITDEIIDREIQSSYDTEYKTEYDYLEQMSIKHSLCNSK